MELSPDCGSLYAYRQTPQLLPSWAWQTSGELGGHLPTYYGGCWVNDKFLPNIYCFWHVKVSLTSWFLTSRVYQRLAIIWLLSKLEAIICDLLHNLLGDIDGMASQSFATMVFWRHGLLILVIAIHPKHPWLPMVLGIAAGTVYPHPGPNPVPAHGRGWAGVRVLEEM